MEGEIFATACRELLRYSIQVRPAGDPLVGDGVQPWQGRECLHPKRWPVCAPRPRTHSAAAMRALPAGWTSAIRALWHAADPADAARRLLQELNG